ncbi:MAG: dihydroorotate dehydrogenase [Desulfobacterales bacterium]|jgi:dihydroorotate dehydrogenase (NAD+) catalytic subunit|nr:dihydroorotate dehydrogenase [Desulfobacterales bacterium]
MSTEAPKLAVTLAGLSLKNPVMTASGTFGYGREFGSLMDLNRLGAIVVKGLALTPVKGNPPPRIVETACGMLNAIGLENVGVDVFVADKLPFLRTVRAPVVANIYGTSVEEYAELAERLDSADGVAAVEVNISCPNVKAGGVAFGVDPAAAERVVRAVRERTRKPVIVKLSPNVTDITVIARSAEAGGADALSLINTITGMAIDVETRRPRLANLTGGLSGPAIKPVALRMVWQVAHAVRLPLVGIGGIMRGEDAVEFLLAGATAVQVGTANFVNPAATLDIIAGIEAYLARHGIGDVNEIVGKLQVG